MCDKANRAEKPELQAAAREDAATATLQVAAAATAAQGHRAQGRGFQESTGC